jgi:hypothetical protein
VKKHNDIIVKANSTGCETIFRFEEKSVSCRHSDFLHLPYVKHLWIIVYKLQTFCENEGVDSDMDPLDWLEKALGEAGITFAFGSGMISVEHNTWIMKLGNYLKDK